MRRSTSRSAVAARLGAIIVAVVAGAAAVAGCGGSTSKSSTVPGATKAATGQGGLVNLDFSKPPAAPVAAAQYPPVAAPASVTIGVFPVFDESLWWVAQKLGYLKDINVNVTSIKAFNSDAAVPEAVGAGSINLGGGATLGVLPLTKTLSSLKWVMTGDVWKGFAFMIRPGHGLKTYGQILAQVHDPSQALRMTAAQMKGKTLVANLGIGHDPVIDGFLAQGGLTRKDIKVDDMPTTEGATAFLRGTGDVYEGDLPSRFRLQQAGDVALVTADELGPGRKAAAAYVGFVATNQWLTANRDAMLRLLGAWYRVADLLHSSQTAVGLNIMRSQINSLTGANFSLPAAQWVNTQVSPWFTFEQAGKDVYTPTGPDSLDRQLNYEIGVTVQEGHLSSGEETPASFSVAQQLYGQLLALKDRTQTDLLAAAKAYNAGKTKGSRATVRSLINKAYWYWQIRDYVDSANLAAQAMNAAV